MLMQVMTIVIRRER